jgi:hypothetical protein
MKIYNYHPTTGEFLGAGEADPDQLDEGNWLIPAYACTDAPPKTGKNKVAVRVSEAWEIADDLRGVVYYTDSPDPHTIETIGELVPDGATSTPPPPSVEELTFLAFNRRDGLLSTAAIRIDPLQDAVDEEEATDEDVARLKAWKQYRIALNRIDQQAGFPATIEWPVTPS